MSHPQELAHAHSLRDPEHYWAHHAQRIDWHKPPTKILRQFRKEVRSGGEYKSWQWFPGAQISTCYNCVDRHVKAGHGESTAIFWDSPVTGQKETFSYSRLLVEVETLAGVLRDEGVEQGDTIVIYMPMIPQALFAMLASARLGAVHAVVFGGFGATALAQRIDACKPRVILTASCGLEGASKVVAYKPLVHGAIAKAKHHPEKVLVWQRPQLKWDVVDREVGERDWKEVVTSARRKGIKADAVVTDSSAGLYIIYTSGTTGAPKGVYRDAGGHAVGLTLAMRSTMGILGPGDVVLSASDIGWVTGHSFVCYGPLLMGAATVLYEGKPVGTPDAGAIWRLVEEYKVNAIFTAPTTLRAIRRDDPKLEQMEMFGRRGGLKSLRTVCLTGERSQPGLIISFQDMLNKYSAQGAIMNDSWGLSEQGLALSCTALIPACSQVPSLEHFRPYEALRVIPGCAGKPMPGMNIHVVDDHGREAPPNTMGNLVMGLPLSPSSFRTLWAEDERFYTSYLKRFDGKWFDTSDAGMIDDNGYVTVMSRSDDVINVAGHRLSTGAIEQAIASHPMVAECCVIGIPDELKGHLPFAFITTFSPIDDGRLFGEVQKLIREQQGSISALGGMIQGKNVIPKTRSGKMLRRNLRELVENAAEGKVDKEVKVPPTIEDPNAVEVARQAVAAYYKGREGPKSKL